MPKRLHPTAAYILEPASWGFKRPSGRRQRARMVAGGSNQVGVDVDSLMQCATLTTVCPNTMSTLPVKWRPMPKVLIPATIFYFDVIILRKLLRRSYYFPAQTLPC